jgi:single-strand DNA-binding protein
MNGVNKVILLGNLGKDPETRHLDSNLVVSRFSLATTENYKDKEGKWISQTEWHNIVAWRGTAEFCENNLKKGMAVYIEGKIRSRSYNDKEGAKKYSTEIVAETINIVGKKSDDRNAEALEEDAREKLPDTPLPEAENELPF